MPTSLKNKMVVPQVMADMISASLPKQLKFINIAGVDTTLEGQAGDTITIPAWQYIGPAVDVAEYTAIPVAEMKSTTKSVTIKKAGQAIELSDEAVLAGYGNPTGEGVRQLGMSIADKIDNDVITALNTTTISYKASALTYEAIVDAVDKFEEESEYEKVLFLHPQEITMLRKDPNFIDKSKYGAEVVATGEVGMIAGCRIVRSRKVPKVGNKFTNFIVCLSTMTDEGTPTLPAVTIVMKRNIMVESDRDILKKSTVVSADQHYGVALTNPAKVIKFEVGE